MYSEIATLLDGIFDRRQRVAAFAAVALVSGTIVLAIYVTPDQRETFIEANDIEITSIVNGMQIGNNEATSFVLLPEQYFALPSNHNCDDMVVKTDFTSWCSPYNSPLNY